MYGKLGVIFVTLLVILFRMAKYLFIPQTSPLIPLILGYVMVVLCLLDEIELWIDLWTHTYLMLPVIQLVASWLPYLVFLALI